MPAVKICALLVTAILLGCAGAHRHGDTGLTFDEISVPAQKYPSLADVDIDPSFLEEHRRKLNPYNAKCAYKCSMRDTNIIGSHECGTWYKMDPKYTVEFLKDHAVVTGTEDQACTCDGCNGNDALSYCPEDKPYDKSDEKADYMDIDTAKTLGKIGQMRVKIVDDFVDLEKCQKNEFCRKHNCLPVRCLHIEIVL